MTEKIISQKPTHSVMASMVVAKHFEFEAAHQLPTDPMYGKCQHLHGHTYKLIVTVRGPISPNGWVVNFSSIKRIVTANIIEVVDHTNLNESTNLSITTAENLLVWMYERIAPRFVGLEYDIQSMRLYETTNSYAELTIN